MIRIEGISKHYRQVPVLEDVNLTIAPGGVISLIGPNGAGKSTLLSVLARLIKPDQGAVHIDELNLHECDSSVLARRIAMQRQEHHFVSRLTVRELVSFGRFPYSRGRLSAEDQEKTDHALAFLDLQPFASRYLDELSGGQRQRVCIAMTLCQDTPYVLLDEPLNNLDMKNAVLTMKRVRGMADELGKTVVVVLHDINFASVYSDRIIAMKDGRVVFDDTPARIMQGDCLQDIFDIPVQVTAVGEKRIGVYF